MGLSLNLVSTGLLIYQVFVTAHLTGNTAYISFQCLTVGLVSPKLLNSSPLTALPNTAINAFQATPMCQPPLDTKL